MKVYSLCAAEGYEDSLKDLVDTDVFPYEITVYIGDKVKFKPGDFIPHLADLIIDNVDGECGEWADSWRESIIAKKAILQKDLEGYFNRWCNRKRCRLKFFNVENVEKVTYKVINESTFELLGAK